MLVYIQSFIAICLGIIASITDFKSKKIYNKNIIIGTILSFIIYLIFWKEIEFIYIKNYLINIGIGLLISFLFFYFKIWAAGDAKLFMVIMLMIPYEIYEVETSNLFPGLHLLILIFSSAFLYVALETLYLWIIDKDKVKFFDKEKINKNQLINFLINYLMGYFIILFINNITIKYFEDFRINNAGLMLILNMLILIYVYRIIRKRKNIIISALIFFILNLTYYLVFGFNFYPINIKMFAIVLIILIIRNVSEKYNYKEINISDLKPRMILSFESVIKFYGSRIKGLPESTTETTDSRLTKEEVESIKRWSKSKRGQSTIIIVRHMPFAPFILIGELIFFILRLYS